MKSRRSSISSTATASLDAPLFGEESGFSSSSLIASAGRENRERNDDTEDDRTVSMKDLDFLTGLVVSSPTVGGGRATLANHDLSLLLASVGKDREAKKTSIIQPTTPPSPAENDNTLTTTEGKSQQQLRSCLKRETHKSSRKSVQFGSPQGVAFRKEDPADTLTPLPKTDMLKLEQERARTEAEEEKRRREEEEDEVTQRNAQTLGVFDAAADDDDDENRPRGKNAQLTSANLAKKGNHTTMSRRRHSIAITTSVPRRTSSDKPLVSGNAAASLARMRRRRTSIMGAPSLARLEEEGESADDSISSNSSGGVLDPFSNANNKREDEDDDDYDLDDNDDATMDALTLGDLLRLDSSNLTTSAFTQTVIPQLGLGRRGEGGMMMMATTTGGENFQATSDEDQEEEELASPTLNSMARSPTMDPLALQDLLESSSSSNVAGTGKIKPRSPTMDPITLQSLVCDYQQEKSEQSASIRLDLSTTSPPAAADVSTPVSSHSTTPSSNSVNWGTTTTTVAKKRSPTMGPLELRDLVDFAATTSSSSPAPSRAARQKSPAPAPPIRRKRTLAEALKDMRLPSLVNDAVDEAEELAARASYLINATALVEAPSREALTFASTQLASITRQREEAIADPGMLGLGVRWGEAALDSDREREAREVAVLSARHELAAWLVKLEEMRRVKLLKTLSIVRQDAEKMDGVLVRLREAEDRAEEIIEAARRSEAMRAKIVALSADLRRETEAEEDIARRVRICVEERDAARGAAERARAELLALASIPPLAEVEAATEKDVSRARIQESLATWRLSRVREDFAELCFPAREGSTTTALVDFSDPSLGEGARSAVLTISVTSAEGGSTSTRTTVEVSDLPGALAAVEHGRFISLT